MTVLIAPDKFKGSLTAEEVCRAIGKGLRRANAAIKTTFHPMADGGDGSLEVLKAHLDLQAVTLSTLDPLGRTIEASYYLHQQTAFIEVATASGLVLLKPEERNVLLSSTYGTGLMVADALKNGCQHIYLFLGGSATNDAGMGIASALGVQFLDAKGATLSPIGQHLTKVNSIKTPELKDVQFTLLCDVTNPMYGPNGAAHVYARQKGANEEAIAVLDRGLQNFNNVLTTHLQKDVSQLPGAGAAGAIGACMVAIFGAQMKKGFETIAELTHLAKAIQKADWVISGEGRLDEQSLQGKVIDGVANLCRKHQKPLSLLVGKNELDNEQTQKIGIHEVLSIVDQEPDIKKAMTQGFKILESLAFLMGSKHPQS